MILLGIFLVLFTRCLVVGRIKNHKNAFGLCAPSSPQKRDKEGWQIINIQLYQLQIGSKLHCCIDTLVLIRNFRFLIKIAILNINLVTYFFTENRVHKRHLNICFAGLKITVKILLEQNICFFRCPSRYAKLWRCVDVK